MLLLARDEDDGSALTDRQVRDDIMTLLVAHAAERGRTFSFLTMTRFTCGTARCHRRQWLLPVSGPPTGRRAVAARAFASRAAGSWNTEGRAMAPT